MTLSKLNDLNLPDADEGEEVIDFDSLPPQFGDLADPIQPGTYEFRLPKVGPDYEAIVDKQGKPRLKVMFKDACQMKIVGTTDRFRHTFNTIPMNKGEGKPKVASSTYFLQAVGKVPKSASRKDIGAAINEACEEERSFLGTTTLTAYCDPLKDVYGPDGQKNVGVKGCGRRYSSSPYKPAPDKFAKNVSAGDPHGGERFPVPKDAEDKEKYAFKFLCKCEKNVVRAYANIEVYRSAS